MRAYRCDRCGVVVDEPAALDWFELGKPARDVEPATFCTARCLSAWIGDEIEKGSLT